MNFVEIWNKYTQSPGLSDSTLANFDTEKRYFVESYLDKGGQWVGMLVIFPESEDGKPICQKVCWSDDEERTAAVAHYIATGLKLILKHAEEMKKNGTDGRKGTIYRNGYEQCGNG